MIPLFIIYEVFLMENNYMSYKPVNDDLQSFPDPLESSAAGQGQGEVKSGSLMERKMLEMLHQGFHIETISSKSYKQLCDAVIAEDDKKIIKDIMLDTVKHRKCFEELFYNFCGARPAGPPEQQPRHHFRSKTLPQIFEERMLEELLNVEFYRHIYFALANLEYRDTLFEIITDKLRHSQLLNYLYAKYRCGV